MREHPLLMKGPLVRAILEGRKTQTRRPIKQEAQPDLGFEWSECLCREIDPIDTPCVTCSVRFPGIPEAGDRLWVRETFAIVHPCRDCEAGYVDDIKQPSVIPKDNAGGYWVPWYRSDWKGDDDTERGFQWTPSIHMPRWACRLVLPLVSVRVERVQDITDADAEAEGVREWAKSDPKLGMMRGMGFGIPTRPRFLFQLCWTSIYGQASWDSNPWVWVAEWKDIEART